MAENNNVDQPTQDEFDRLLDDFISQQLSEAEDNVEDATERLETNKPAPNYNAAEEEVAKNLFQEERQLYEAYRNFCNAVIAVAQNSGIEAPKFEFSGKQLYSRFRPKRTRRLNNDIFKGWETLVMAQPVRLSSLPANASDEQILNFAEKTTDENLQNALISYVEILIELDGCEIAYNMRKARAEKRKIEKQIFEEHQRRKNTMQKFIKAIQEQKFPIDAERLVTNYFKAVRKDPEGAQKILENNPATFAPIEVEKIPSRFFGMIKAKPEDGIRVNKEIGKFLKNLKA